MAQKQTDPTLRTASIIVNRMGDTALTYRNKAPNDKTFSATILGVNRKFTDDVSEQDKTAIIEKFSIPEAVEEGEQAYYTFKINGAYYVKRSPYTFKLYEKVTVRIPNGSWDNMYIEYKANEVELPKVYYSVTEPTEDIKEGDYWVKIYTNADALYVYSGEEWEKKTGFYNLVAAYREPNTTFYSVGDHWLKYDNSTYKSAISLYELNTSGNWSETVRFVGRFADVSGTSEIFNDYVNNTSTGAYNHTEGAENSLSRINTNNSGIESIPQYTHIQGKGNTVTGGTTNHIEGSENMLTNEPDVLTLNNGALNIATENHIEGLKNELHTVKNAANISPVGNHVGGTENKLYGGQGVVVSGNKNIVGTAAGTDTAQNSVVSGENNSIVHGIHDSAIIGSKNTSIGEINTSAVFGTGHEEGGNDKFTTGRYSERVSSALFTVGNGSKSGDTITRQNAFRVDDNGDAYVSRKLYVNGTEITPGGGTYTAGTGIDITNNAISVNDVYSTTETLTGKVWIDGKPIYRTVYQIVIPNAMADITSGIVPKNSELFPANVNEVVYVSGYYKSNAGIFFLLPDTSIRYRAIIWSDIGVFFGISLSSGTLMPYSIDIYNTASDANGRTATVIVEYTKTIT